MTLLTKGFVDNDTLWMPCLWNANAELAISHQWCFIFPVIIQNLEIWILVAYARGYMHIAFKVVERSKECIQRLKYYPELFFSRLGKVVTYIIFFNSLMFVFFPIGAPTSLCSPSEAAWVRNLILVWCHLIKKFLQVWKFKTFAKCVKLWII